MSSQSIQELETYLETTFENIEKLHIKIRKYEASSHEIATLRRLQYAHIDLALALCRNIKMIRAICCASVLIGKELHEAEMELVVSENRLGAFEDGSITRRENRFKVAEARWWSAIDERIKHRSTCRTCAANYLDSKFAS